MKRSPRRRRAHPGRVLLAVGDRDLAAQLSDWLTEATGCDVTGVRDLRNGWSLCHGGPWRLVLTASRLREGPGLALLSRIKTLTPDVPTVLLTEYRPGDLALDQMAYVDALLCLPPQRDAVITAALRLIGRGRPAQRPARPPRSPMTWTGTVADLARPAPETFDHPLGFAAPRWGQGLTAG